jgi:hypothetical protein
MTNSIMSCEKPATRVSACLDRHRPRLPQLPDDAQDHDPCHWAAVSTAAAAPGPSPHHDVRHAHPKV